MWPDCSISVDQQRAALCRLTSSNITTRGAAAVKLLNANTRAPIWSECL